VLWQDQPTDVIKRRILTVSNLLTPPQLPLPTNSIPPSTSTTTNLHRPARWLNDRFWLSPPPDPHLNHPPHPSPLLPCLSLNTKSPHFHTKLYPPTCTLLPHHPTSKPSSTSPYTPPHQPHHHHNPTPVDHTLPLSSPTHKLTTSPSKTKLACIIV